MATQTPGSSRRGSERDRDRTVTVHLDDGRQLGYTEYGRSDGVPVVFLHGTPGSRRLGTLFESAARERGIRLLALDRPGYGHSSPWPTRSITDASQFVSAILDDADVQTAGLIAFSGSGPYALATAAVEADRVDRVDVVSGTTPPTASEETPAIQRLLAGLATTTPSFEDYSVGRHGWQATLIRPSSSRSTPRTTPSRCPTTSQKP